MNAARATPAAMSRLNSTTTSTPNTAAAMAARLMAALQVGGLSSRSWRRWRATRFASSRVCGRPVRPARSIVPAAVPRCLRRRLRFVWAIPRATLPDGGQGSLQNVAFWREAAQRDVVRESVKCGLRSEPHELRLRDRRLRPHALDDHAQRDGAMVVHVGRHLRPAPVLQVQAERPHAWEPARARLTQTRRDALGEVEVVRGEVD